MHPLVTLFLDDLGFVDSVNCLVLDLKDELDLLGNLSLFDLEFIDKSFHSSLLLNKFR